MKLALVVLAAWPLVHHALVLRWGVDPWHLAGWSMYCKPRAPLSVTLNDGRGGAIPMNRLPKAVDDAIGAWAKRRKVYGELLSPDELSREIFAAVSWLHAFEIVVVTYDFRADTARFEKLERAYRYEKP